MVLACGELFELRQRQKTNKCKNTLENKDKSWIISSAAPNLHLICDKIATFTKKLVKKCSKYDNNGVDYCQYSGILGVKSETCRAFDEQDSCLNSNVKLSQIKRRTT